MREFPIDLTDAEALEWVIIALDAVIAQPWEPEAPDVLCAARDFLAAQPRRRKPGGDA